MAEWYAVYPFSHDLDGCVSLVRLVVGQHDARLMGPGGVTSIVCWKRFDCGNGNIRISKADR